MSDKAANIQKLFHEQKHHQFKKTPWNYTGQLQHAHPDWLQCQAISCWSFRANRIRLFSCWVARVPFE